MKYHSFRILIIIVLLIIGASVFAQQQSRRDSLLNLLSTQPQDESKVRTYIYLVKEYRTRNLDSSLMFINEGLFLAKKLEYNFGIGEMYASHGDIKVIQNEMFQALDYYMKAVEFLEKTDYHTDLSQVYLVIGNVLFTQANYPNALEYYQKGLKLADSLNAVGILPHFYNNMGELYKIQEDYNQSMAHHQSALGIYEDMNDISGIAGTLLNISMLHFNTGDFEKARATLNEAREIEEKLQHYEGLFNVFHSLGRIEEASGNILLAIENYNESEKYLGKIGGDYLGPTAIMQVNLNKDLGNCFMKLGQFEKSKELLLQTYQKANRTGQLEAMKEISFFLSEIYRNTNQPVKSLEYYKTYKLYSDSISKDENIKKITQLEMQFEFDKKIKAREIEELDYREAQKRKELRYMIFLGGAVLSLIIISLLLNMQRLKRKNLTLEKDSLKHDLDFKNKELTTNVMYLLKKNEFIINISDKLKKSKYNFKPENRKVIDEIIRELELSTREVSWEEFEVRFQEVHNNFYKNLNEQFPDLTPNELKLCAFLRLNMSTKEISAITYQSQKSISMARYRLRKKLGLDDHANLITFLNQL